MFIRVNCRGSADYVITALQEQSRPSKGADGLNRGTAGVATLARRRAPDGARCTVGDGGPGAAVRVQGAARVAPRPFSPSAAAAEAPLRNTEAGPHRNSRARSIGNSGANQSTTVPGYETSACPSFSSAGRRNPTACSERERQLAVRSEDYTCSDATDARVRGDDTST
ncbi:hypothetical protein DBV15_08117 [Temnothorax longispinosus]|uniref:Uncharacterized protein n=1 Tax=Temnothorax longispinosus TaxID=300112 RepID=A0A4S2KID9_9HYME|nr:hypothetical protein DBV15_08117 [Temnothorax longispinosus]